MRELTAKEVKEALDQNPDEMAIYTRLSDGVGLLEVKQDCEAFIHRLTLDLLNKYQIEFAKDTSDRLRTRAYKGAIKRVLYKDINRKAGQPYKEYFQQQAEALSKAIQELVAKERSQQANAGHSAGAKGNGSASAAIQLSEDDCSGFVAHLESARKAKGFSPKKVDNLLNGYQKQVAEGIQNVPGFWESEQWQHLKAGLPEQNDAVARNVFRLLSYEAAQDRLLLPKLKQLMPAILELVATLAEDEGFDEAAASRSYRGKISQMIDQHQKEGIRARADALVDSFKQSIHYTQLDGTVSPDKLADVQFILESTVRYFAVDKTRVLANFDATYLQALVRFATATADVEGFRQPGFDAGKFV